MRNPSRRTENISYFFGLFVGWLVCFLFVCLLINLDDAFIFLRHRVGAGDEDSQYLKLGGEWDSQSENTEYSHSKQQTKKRYK